MFFLDIFFLENLKKNKEKMEKNMHYFFIIPFYTKISENIIKLIEKFSINDIIKNKLLEIYKNDFFNIHDSFIDTKKKYSDTILCMQNEINEFKNKNITKNDDNENEKKIDNNNNILEKENSILNNTTKKLNLKDIDIDIKKNIPVYKTFIFLYTLLKHKMSLINFNSANDENDDHYIKQDIKKYNNFYSKFKEICINFFDYIKNYKRNKIKKTNNILFLYNFTLTYLNLYEIHVFDMCIKNKVDFDFVFPVIKKFKKENYYILFMDDVIALENIRLFYVFLENLKNKKKNFILSKNIILNKKKEKIIECKIKLNKKINNDDNNIIKNYTKNIFENSINKIFKYLMFFYDEKEIPIIPDSDF